MSRVPPHPPLAATLALFQDVFQLALMIFVVALFCGQRHLPHPPPPLHPAPHSTVQNDALALPPRRQINQWKMSLPECRFVGVGVAAAAVCSPPCIWFYACLRATAEP